MDKLWQLQLANLEGDDWKVARSLFTPIFTSGKMKGMVKVMEEIGARLTDALDKKLEQGVDFEIKDLMGKFSMDTLAASVFSIDPQSFKEVGEEQTEFVKHAAKIFKNGLDQIIISLRLIPFIGWINKLLKLNLNKPKSTRFFIQIVTDIIAERRRTGLKKNDLIDLMLDCMNQEDNSNDMGEATGKHTRSKDNKSIDDNILIATAMIFLIAGYDTTSLTLSFLAYELAKHPDAQNRLQQEIDEAYEDVDDSNAQLPEYTTIQNLSYLDNCIMETLRLHPVVGDIIRTCTQDTKIDGVDHMFRKDDMVSISAIGIQQDERYYPNPGQYNPDNFSKEARAQRDPYTFLSFGQGPRNCIGMRFALLEIKVIFLFTKLSHIL